MQHNTTLLAYTDKTNDGNSAQSTIKETISETAQEISAKAEEKTDIFGKFSHLVPLVLIFIVFYFLLIMPQQRKMKEQKNLINSAKKGDKVLTASGIFATIVEINSANDEVSLQISENVVIKMLKSHIVTILNNENKK